MMSRFVHVSAALVTDATGRALLVRKHGTTVFMQPGGKPEPGETPEAALTRELREEIGVSVLPADLRPLGRFEAEAANEPDHRVIAHAFAVTIEPAAVRMGAEIDELRWVTAETASVLRLAPLTRDHLLPLLRP